jgi:cullin-associated NEDD8-dissociated protein 1
LHRYTSGLPVDLPATLIPQLHGYITTADISLLSQAVSIVALLLQLSPVTTFPEVESELLKDIYTVSHAPPVSGAALDSLLSFFSALVAADVQIAAHVVPNLMVAVDKAAKSEASYANVARCIAQVVRSQQGIAAGTIAEFVKHLKVCPFD